MKKKISKRNVINEELFSDMSLISYIDENLIVIYAPALDLFGYGHDESEANKSFHIVYNEYIQYGIKNNCLEKDLKKHGWKLNRKSGKFSSPVISDLIDNNEVLKSVIDSRPFKKFNMNISFPVLSK